MSLHIAVVCGSVRSNRNSILATNYLAKKLRAVEHKSTVVDFIELPLPFVNTDPNPSKLNKNYPDANVQKWSQIADSADGFIFVAPEYNHGISAVLKNALDWLYPEFKHKPAGLVGVSDGDGGGVRAVEMLRPLMANFAIYDIRESVAFRKTQNLFDAEANLLDSSYEKRVDDMIASLVKVAEVMKALRI